MKAIKSGMTIYWIVTEDIGDNQEKLTKEWQVSEMLDENSQVTSFEIFDEFGNEPTKEKYSQIIQEISDFVEKESEKEETI